LTRPVGINDNILGHESSIGGVSKVTSLTLVEFEELSYPCGNAL
jgi:hypothetical protein